MKENKCKLNICDQKSLITFNGAVTTLASNNDIKCFQYDNDLNKDNDETNDFDQIEI